jgi:hypothetical protein
MGLFNFWKTKDQTDMDNVVKQPARNSVIKDFTEGYKANSTLTKGLYHNTYPGFKLAGGLAYTPIAVPVWFMGMPIPTLPENDQNQELVDKMLKQFAVAINNIHTQCHREGTIWVWPRWSAKSNKLIWEFIEDDTVTDIIKDMESDEIIEIITNEQMRVSTGENRIVTVSRKRIFTRERITVEWTGAELLPGDLRSGSVRNPLRILPIPFSNNADQSEYRGHSDYERIIPDLKNYHDIDLAWSTMLAKFNPKMLQNVMNLQGWLANNGWGNIADIDIQAVDLIVNVGEGEKTEFAFPERAHEAYEVKQKNTYRKIVEASGIPEIAWGLKTEGNRASVESNMDVLIKFVDDKRRQKNEPYRMLFSASLALMAMVDMREVSQVLDIKWNKMDAVSDEVRSIIFRNYMQGIASVVNVAGMSPEQLWKFYRDLYPSVTESDYKEFRKGLSDMGGHKQWTNSSFAENIDLGGDPNLTNDVI